MTRLYVHEVVTRDGFQIEPRFIPTEEKIALVDRLSETGLHKIEVTSFVSPKAVPALADAEAVMAGITRNPAVKYVALVANPKGAERALAAKVDEIVLVISVSESHNRSNVRRSTEESFAGFAEIMNTLEGTAMKVACGMATTFGCPFEGFQPLDRILRFVDRLVGLGIDSIALADTIGMGNPTQILEICNEARARFPRYEFALHLHNTRGMGLANVLSGLEAGITHYESSLGGLGGCPFAPGASGNVCSEDLVHALHAMGVGTGIDLDRLLAVSRRVEAIIGRVLPGQIMKAGPSTRRYPLPDGVALRLSGVR
jgi:hydroxymethylglutaryl-CoA lyase